MGIRKRLVELDSPEKASGWLAVDQIAQIEVTSEDPAHPVDAALVERPGGGWRASQPGEQIVRLVFDEPRAIKLIRLVFDEREQERVHEFTLRWSSDHGLTFRQIVRQQFSFSPSGATRELEEYVVDLSAATDLELRIVPDVSHRPVVASLREFRIR
jgi:hypothetical protein